jgi:sialic acid synthase SpsE
LEEIDRAVDILKHHNLPFICIMHCIMLYPVPHNLLNLNFIDTLLMRYKQPIGFSDHSKGIEAALLSIGKGVKAIEKHFTLNKNQKGGDHKNSLSPAELKELVKKIRFHEQMLGPRQRIISKQEKKERTYARRGIYAGKDLKKGDLLTLNNLAFLRPNISIGVENICYLIGKQINQNVGKGTPINLSMIDRTENINTSV